MSNLPLPYWLPLQQSFQQFADANIARGAEAYMKHISQFYGIKSQKRRELLTDFLKTQGLPDISMLDKVVKNAWAQPQREFQYAAMEVLGKASKKCPPETIILYEWMMLNKSWWDTIDYIAPTLVGHHFERFPQLRDPTLARWMDSGNFWLQRACLLFQLKYKTDTDEILLFNLVSRLSVEKEFFIRKAIGWALRQYARTNADAVKSFVVKTPLSGLSRREALKHIG
jgi:3-methyladenine DNA glycosylase AlkD